MTNLGEPEVESGYCERPDLGLELAILIVLLDGCFPPVSVRNPLLSYLSAPTNVRSKVGEMSAWGLA